MARRLTELLEEEGPEDEPIIPPGVLEQDEPPASAYAALLGRPQEDAPPPPLVPASTPAAGGMSRPPLRRGGPRDDLLDAQAADKDEQRKADFESGLDTLAFRRPMQARQVGSPNADALMKRLGLQRQGEQDELSTRLREAQISKLGREKPAGATVDRAAQDDLMRARAEALRAKQAREGAGAAEADEDLEAFRDSMSKVLGKDLKGMSRKSIEALAKQLGADKVLADRRAARAAKAAKGGAGGGGLKMTAGETTKVADLDTAAKVMDSLWGTFGAKASGPGASVAQWIPATQAKEYNDKRKVTAQVVGGILEGGKLTEEDFARYYAMLPDPSDSPSRARAKWEAVQELVRLKRTTGVDTLKRAGFNVGGLADTPAAPVPPGLNLDAPARKPGQRVRSPKGRTGTVGPDGKIQWDPAHG